MNTLFLLDAGLTLFEVFLANAAFSAGMVIFEVPTGVIADTLGRRASVVVGSLVLAAATMGYVALSFAETGVIPYMAVSVAMGLGFTFQSGAVEAWVVDAIHSVDPGRELDSVFARAQSVTAGAMLVGTIGGGVLGQADLAIPFVARAGVLLILFVLAMRLMSDLGFERRTVTLRSLPAETARVARVGVSHGWRVRSLRYLMAASFLQTGFFFWAFYVWQPHLLDLLARDAIWVAGLFSGLLSLAMMGGNAIVGWATRFCGKRTTLMMWALAVEGASAIGVGMTSEFWVAAPLFLVGVAAIGVMIPVRQAYFHQMVPTQERATVLSFDSMIANAGGVAGQAGLGGLGDARSVQAGFVVGGLATLLAIPMVAAVRSMEEQADVIVGRDAVPGTRCTVPDVNVVNTVAEPETVF